MLAIRAKYLMGACRAGQYHDRGMSEWPPHPIRLHSAMVAAGCTSDFREKAIEAIKWLERQPVPAIRASDAMERDRVTNFVPQAYPYAKSGPLRGNPLPEIRGKLSREFATAWPIEPHVHFVWPDAEPSDTIRETLAKIVDRVGYLGRASSLVRMTLCDEVPSPNYLPDPAGDVFLRAPFDGRFEELEAAFQSDRRPTPGPLVNYRRVGDQEEVLRSEFAELMTFRLEGSRLPIEGVLPLAERLREAVLAKAGELGIETPLLHGHGHVPHCAYVPLPHVGSRYARGSILGFAIVFPRDTSLQEQMNVLRAVREVREIRLRNPLPVLKVSPDAGSATTLRPTTWSRRGKTFATVTPILLDQYPKKKHTAESIVAAACRYAGLPEPASIRCSLHSVFNGAPPASDFQSNRSGKKKRFAIHAVLEWAQPVQGPVLLGAGRYFGMGLLQPATIWPRKLRGAA